MNVALARTDGLETEAVTTANTQVASDWEIPVRTDTVGEGTNVVWLISCRDDAGRKVVQLRVPLRVTLSVDPDDRTHIAFAPYVRCCGNGTDFSSALDDLACDILTLREELSGEPDTSLAEDAQELKRRLLHLIP
jgi:hypothetical protein